MLLLFSGYFIRLFELYCNLLCIYHEVFQASPFVSLITVGHLNFHTLGKICQEHRSRPLEGPKTGQAEQPYAPSWC